MSMVCMAQTYGMERVNDTLTYLTLTTGNYTGRYTVRFPVYRLETGDVDGDGLEDAIVGVVNRTRHDPNLRKRIHIFKNVGGRIRPMWLGSQLGGILEDFRFIDGQVRTLQSTTDGRYVVMTHRWRPFGLGADSILVKNVSLEEAENCLKNTKPSPKIEH
ncbi:MAG: hypothetical protein IKX36_04835 [Prevotella sp.]|nr:hypothetical protein [Prevotella sp.]